MNYHQKYKTWLPTSSQWLPQIFSEIIETNLNVIKCSLIYHSMKLREGNVFNVWSQVPSGGLVCLVSGPFEEYASTLREGNRLYLHPRKVHPLERYLPRRYTPWKGTSPEGTPPGKVHPQKVQPLGRYSPHKVLPGKILPQLLASIVFQKWAVCILLECILVSFQSKHMIASCLYCD